MFRIIFAFCFLPFFSESLTIGIISDSIGIDLPDRISFATYIEESLNCGIVKDAWSGSPTLSGPRRLISLLEKNHIDILIITLGFNNLPLNISPKQTEIDLMKMVNLAKKNYIPVYIGKIEFMCYLNPVTYQENRWYDRSVIQQFFYLYSLESVYHKLEKLGACIFPFLTKEIILNHTIDFVHPTSLGGCLISQAFLYKFHLTDRKELID